MPRFLINSLLVIVAIIGIAGLASGDDKADRDRRAKAAVAVAKAIGDHSPKVVVAPAPRKTEPKSYATGGKEAILDQSPLVVYVSCEGPKVEGAITCFVSAKTFGEVTGPAVVIGYPVGDRLLIEKTLPCPVPAADLRKAVDAAAKKIRGTEPKAMPSGLPKPLDTQVKKTGCICGQSCQCPEGRCPGQCPVATKPDPVVVGYRYQKVCNGNGTCQIVTVPIYR